MVLQPAQYGKWHPSLCNKVKLSVKRENHKKQVFRRWKKSGTVYPMAWDLGNTEVAGVNRTDYYQTACNQC